MFQTLDRAIRLLAQLLAWAGGIILIAVVVLSCISIIGRAFVPLDIGLGPIRGIYDITEIGMAAAVFAFLPWCQYQRGHATVELFTPFMPMVLNDILTLLFDMAMCALAVLLAWRLYLGMLDKLSYGETTLIAQLPVWQGYAAGLVGAVGFALVAGFCVIRSARDLFSPSSKGAPHV